MSVLRPVRILHAFDRKIPRVQPSFHICVGGTLDYSSVQIPVAGLLLGPLGEPTSPVRLWILFNQFKRVHSECSLDGATFHLLTHCRSRLYDGSWLRYSSRKLSRWDYLCMQFLPCDFDLWFSLSFSEPLLILSLSRHMGLQSDVTCSRRIFP